MAVRLVTYMIAHQPRRPRLPVPSIPRDLPTEEWGDFLFDEPMNRYYLEKVASRSYHPATELFLDLADHGLCLGLGLSWSLVEQMKKWDPDLFEKMKRLLSHPNVEPVGVEPYHSILFYMDIDRFIQRMKWARDRLSDLAGKPVKVTDTTEMFMSNDLYYALGQAGFDAVMMDGRPWALDWRQPSYLYHSESYPKIFCRHQQLSDDIGLRFNDRSWPAWPLHPDSYAAWIRETVGDLVFLGWDMETFGEHLTAEDGIFDFVQKLPHALQVRGVTGMTPSRALAELKNESRYLPLPEFPVTWAGSGHEKFFLGNSEQQAIFQLMHHAYNKATLTKDPALLDLSLWLMSSDYLHELQWWQHAGKEAEESAGFTPKEWWHLGAEGIIRQFQEVYKEFIRACDGKVMLKGPSRTPRRASLGTAAPRS
jgi:alpha-amylase